MSINSKEAFFAAIPAPAVEEVKLPGGQTVRIRQVTVRERERFELACQGKNLGAIHVRARLLIATAVDEEGDSLFDESDIPRLIGLPIGHVEPLVEAANRLNALTAKDVEDLEKN